MLNLCKFLKRLFIKRLVSYEFFFKSYVAYLVEKHDMTQNFHSMNWWYILKTIIAYTFH